MFSRMSAVAVARANGGMSSSSFCSALARRCSALYGVAACCTVLQPQPAGGIGSSSYYSATRGAGGGSGGPYSVRQSPRARTSMQAARMLCTTRCMLGRCTSHAARSAFYVARCAGRVLYVHMYSAQRVARARRGTLGTLPSNATLRTVRPPAGSTQSHQSWSERVCCTRCHPICRVLYAACTMLNVSCGRKHSALSVACTDACGMWLLAASYSHTTLQQTGAQRAATCGLISFAAGRFVSEV
jgi:hypothetical protein